VRIALKPVTDSPSTADTSSTSKSSGGSFLDILTQGTQDAVQPAKGYGSQTQSDAHSSSQNTADDTQSKGPSSQTNTSASTSDGSPRVPTTQAANASSNQQSGKTAAGTTQGNTISDQSPATQSLNRLLTLMDLAAAGNNVATVSSAAQQSAAASTDQTASLGKQAGTAKGVQGKQDAPKGSDPGTVSLQQAMALTVPAAVADPLPQIVVAATQSSTSQNQTADAANASQPAAIAAMQAAAAEQAGSRVAASAALAGEAAAQSPAQNTTDQSQPAAASSQTSSAQGQQGQPAASAQASGNGFQHDLAVLATTAATSSLPDVPADASNAARDSSQKSMPTFIPTEGSTFGAAALQQNDAGADQTAKVIPFKLSSTNPGANSNTPGAASANGAGTTTAATSAFQATAASKSNTQDSSSSSSRDSQGNNDAGANTQGANAAARTTDAVTTQTAALGTFAAAHAAAQSTSTNSSSDVVPQHTSLSRNVASEAANASLPASSSAINSARVIQSMNETEMRVGMRSTEFGDISIRTMVTQQQMQTQISVDHSELVSALTAHIPAVQAKLGSDYGLHASIEVSQGGASFTGNQQQSSQREYKPSTPFVQMDVVGSTTDTERASARATVAAAAAIEGSRLDIRA